MLSDESDLYMLGNGVACSHTVLELFLHWEIRFSNML